MEADKLWKDYCRVRAICVNSAIRVEADLMGCYNPFVVALATSLYDKLDNEVKEKVELKVLVDSGELESLNCIREYCPCSGLSFEKRYSTRIRGAVLGKVIGITKG